MNQSINKWRFPVWVLCAYATFAFGQERKTYEGDLQLGPYAGEATYQFMISGLDSIYDGDFEVQKSNLETLMEREDSSFLFKGAFDLGVATGPWRFQFGEFKTNSQSELVGYEYRVLVSGRQEVGAGELVQGKPNGTWTYTINQIKDSEIERILFKSTMSFEKGIPQQNFQVENESSVLVGRVLRNGLAHDKWSYYATDNVEDVEDWIFEDGMLRRIESNAVATPNIISIFESNAPEYQIIPLDDRYFALLQAVLQDDQDKSAIASLLAENQGYYKKMDDVLGYLNSPGMDTGIKVKVPHHPLDSLQNARLQQIVSEYKVAAEIGVSILENSHLNIVKRNDPEAQFYYQVAEHISKRFLGPLKTLTSYVEDEIIQFQPITKTVQRLWPNGTPEKEIVVPNPEDGTQRIFRLPSSDEFGFQGTDILSISALTTYARMSLEYIKGSLASRLTNAAQLQALNQLEEELIVLNDSLELQLDSIAPSLPKNYHRAFNRIEVLADSLLTTYAAIENTKDKLVFGKETKSCLSHLITLAIAVEKLPEQQEEIQKVYTDTVWNPFMANVMEEQVKKRIVGTYETILIPYFLSMASTELQCDNALNQHELMVQTYKRLLELREMDTKKLERRLRREKRPKEVLKLLFQQSTLRNQ